MKATGFFMRLKTDGWSSFLSPLPLNFLLCQWQRTDNLDHLLVRLLENGMYIRDCRNFAGLEENFFRVGLRIPGENDQLLRAIAATANA